MPSLRPATRIYLARHGETQENLRGLIQGQRHGRLTSRGHAQAALIARALQDAGLASIYSSDLARAHDTAVIIGGELSLAVKADRRLRERNLGTFEGRPRADFFADQQLSGEPYILYRPDVGETLLEMAERVRPFLKEVARNHAGQSILIVGHGGINIVIMNIVLPMTLDELFQTGQENACLNIFDLTVEDSPRRAHLKGTAIRLNDCSHLQPVEA